MTTTPLTTELAIEAIHDHGLFEVLATRAICIQYPAYRPMLHPGVNAEQETIPAPVDNLYKVPGSIPSHYVFLAHTTTDTPNLKAKWREDAKKAIAALEELRKIEANAKATLFLTSNRKVNQELWTELQTLAKAANVEIEPLDQSSLARILDSSADGQWARRELLKIERQRLSTDELSILTTWSLAAHAAFIGDTHASIWPERIRVDPLASTRLLLFISSESGGGKSSLTQRLGQEAARAGASVLWLSDDDIANASALPDAITRCLKQLDPTIPSDAGAQALSLSTKARPFLIIVDDIHRGASPLAAAHKLARWSIQPADTRDAQPQWYRIVAPIRSENLTRLEQQWGKSKPTWSTTRLSRLSQGKTEAAITAGMPPNKAPTTGEIRELAELAAGDPFLVGLIVDLTHGTGKLPTPHELTSGVTSTYIDRMTSLTASAHKLAQSSLWAALDHLAAACLSARDLNPKWVNVMESAGPHGPSLQALAHDSTLIRESNGRVEFRHDRIRDALLARALRRALKKEANLPQDVLWEPYYFDLHGLALIQDLDLPRDEIIERAPIAYFEALRLSGRNGLPTAIEDELAQWIQVNVHPDAEASIVDEAARKLYAADHPSVLRLSDRFFKGPLITLARMKQGSVADALREVNNAGLRTASSHRDEAIAICQARHREHFISELTKIIQNPETSADQLGDAYYLVAAMRLEPLVSLVVQTWKERTEKAALLPEALFALLNNGPTDTADLARDMIAFWRSLPSDREKYMKVGDRSYASYALEFAWAHSTIPTISLEVLIHTSKDIELSHQVVSILASIDHPDALQRCIEIGAANDRKHPGNHGIWSRHLIRRWDGHDMHGHAPSPTTQDRARALWQDMSNPDEERRLAFQVWAGNAEATELSELQRASADPSLQWSAWQARARLGDTSVIPELRADKYGLSIAYHHGRELASKDLLDWVEAELQRGRTERTDTHSLARLLMDMAVPDAERVLTTYWDVAQKDDDLVRAAIFVGTEGLKQKVLTALGTTIEPTKVFLHIMMSFGWREHGRTQHLTAQHLTRLEPYLTHFPDSELAHLAEAALDRGLRSWAVAKVQPLMKGEWRSRAIPTVEDLTAEMGKWDDRDPWTLSWFLERRIESDKLDPNSIITAAIAWFKQAPSLDRLTRLHHVWVIAGTRSDIGQFNALDVAGEEDTVRAIRADLAYNLRRKHLR